MDVLKMQNYLHFHLFRNFTNPLNYFFFYKYIFSPLQHTYNNPNYLMCFTLTMYNKALENNGKTVIQLRQK